MRRRRVLSALKVFVSAALLFSCGEKYSAGQLQAAKNLVFSAEIALPSGRTVSLGKAAVLMIEEKGFTPRGTKAEPCVREGFGAGICVEVLWDSGAGRPDGAGWIVLKDGSVHALNDNAEAFGRPRFNPESAKRIFQK